jgi:aryl-phospho-beta-D-glucosidase BglC (GH1 family)
MLKKILKILGIILSGLLGLIAALVVFIVVSPNGKITLPVKHRPAYSHENLAAFPGRLSANGSRLVDPDGEPIFLRGVMPQGPSRLHSRNRFGRRLFDEIAASGANVIRIAVDPESYAGDADYLWRYLDPIVSWAGENGMYAIIDLHYIGNIATGAGEEMIVLEELSPRELSVAFWTQTAAYFKDAPHVIFEIFNEPANIKADAWREHAQELINVIRAQGAEQLIIAGGVEYSRDLSWVLENPLDDGNLAYAAHIYPGHSQALWDFWFGNAAERYPVLLTEWGFMEPDGDPKHDYLVGNVENYGEPLLAYADERLAGWVACWYDDSWFPPMFAKGMKEPTLPGEYVLARLKE